MLIYVKVSNINFYFLKQILLLLQAMAWQRCRNEKSKLVVLQSVDKIIRENEYEMERCFYKLKTV